MTLSPRIAGRVLQAILPEAVVMCDHTAGGRYHVSIDAMPECERFAVLFEHGPAVLLTAADIGACRVSDLRAFVLSYREGP